MRHTIAMGVVVGIGALLLGWSVSGADDALLKKVSGLEQAGLFKQAAALLDQTLAEGSLSGVDRKELEFERDRLERIKKDFPLSREALFAALNKAVKGLTEREFEQWLQEGRFDSRQFDGERRFMVSSVSNLFWRYPELSRRRVPRKDTAALERRVLQTAREIKAAAAAEQKPYVLPKTFEVTMAVTAEPGAAPDGETIRAWLPIPREYPFQAQYEFLSASSPVLHTDPAQSSIRSVLLQQAAKKNEPTRFSIRYRYTAEGVSFNLRPETVHPSPITDPELAKFTGEAPHIVFTPQMRTLSEKVAGNETNPCVKAKRFYDWIAENIKYSYAIEYSTIRNIGEYCRDKGYGDCGQEALLFMTLCRLNGIPARWQSGWNTFPGGQSIHDWSEIYLAPYGWVPVDPYMGIFAMRYATSLKPEQRLEIRDFYFGGLDQYRMIANSDHNQVLSPQKQSLRSDNVDFQRGELEWGSHNIYLDKYSYELSVKEVKVSRGRIE